MANRTTTARSIPLPRLRVAVEPARSRRTRSSATRRSPSPIPPKNPIRTAALGSIRAARRARADDRDRRDEVRDAVEPGGDRAAEELQDRPADRRPDDLGRRLGQLEALVAGDQAVRAQDRRHVAAVGDREEDAQRADRQRDDAQEADRQRRRRRSPRAVAEQGGGPAGRRRRSSSGAGRSGRRRPRPAATGRGTGASRGRPGSRARTAPTCRIRTAMSGRATIETWVPRAETVWPNQSASKARPVGGQREPAPSCRVLASVGRVAEVGQRLVGRLVVRPAGTGRPHARRSRTRLEVVGMEVPVPVAPRAFPIEPSVGDQPEQGGDDGRIPLPAGAGPEALERLVDRQGASGTGGRRSSRRRRRPPPRPARRAGSPRRPGRSGSRTRRTPRGGGGRSPSPTGRGGTGGGSGRRSRCGATSSSARRPSADRA